MSNKIEEREKEEEELGEEIHEVQTYVRKGTNGEGKELFEDFIVRIWLFFSFRFLHGTHDENC